VYRIVKNTTVEGLENRVNALVEEGYVPQGGVNSSQGGYQQAMWKAPDKTMDAGWIEWNGVGETPALPMSTLVEARFGDGSVLVNTVGAWDWAHYGVAACDIVAYRAVK
jgi:hypothetical protein